MSKTNSTRLPRPPAKPGLRLTQTSVVSSTTYVLGISGTGALPRYGDANDPFEPDVVELTVGESKDGRGATVHRWIQSIVAKDVHAGDHEMHAEPTKAQLPEYLREVVTMCGFEGLLS